MVAVDARANLVDAGALASGFRGSSGYAADAITAGDVLTITVYENVDTPLLGAPGARADPAVAVG